MLAVVQNETERGVSRLMVVVADVESRLVVAQETVKAFGIGAEISAMVCEEMIDCLENIRNELYHNKEAVAVPQSTRDLRMGVTLNLVRAHAGSVVHPCVVSGVDIRAMYLRSRGTGGLDVRSGEIVSLYMPRPEAMYYTECEVLGPGEQPATIALSHSVRGSFKTQQLREYWRVDVDIRIQYTNVSSPRLDETGMPRRSEGRLINLSGSGAAMVSGRAPQRGECLQFSLPLHDKEINGLEAEVLHVVKLPTHTYRLHMVFRSLGEEDREKIIRSLFHWYRNRMPSGSTES